MAAPVAASAATPPQRHPATHLPPDRNRRRGGSGSPAPCCPRHGRCFRFRRMSSWTFSPHVIPGCAAARNDDVETSIVHPDRSHLDRADARAGDPRGNRNCLIEILGLNQIVASELLAGFGKGTVGRQYL